MADMADETTGTLQTDLNMGIQQGQKTMSRATSSYGNDETAGGYTQNITINSPTELSPYEVARQTRNATRDMVLNMRKGK